MRVAHHIYIKLCPSTLDIQCINKGKCNHQIYQDFIIPAKYTIWIARGWHIKYQHGFPCKLIKQRIQQIIDWCVETSERAIKYKQQISFFIKLFETLKDHPKGTFLSRLCEDRTPLLTQIC